MSLIKVLIVEDELLIARDLSNKLKKMGFVVVGCLDNGEEVVANVRNNHPDIILMDIKLSGKMDGIAAAEALLEEFEIPVLYLTDQTDEATYNRAKKTRPADFIAKPFNEQDLYRKIDLAFYNASEYSPADDEEAGGGNIYLIKDAFFVKTKEQTFEKVKVDDIVYLDADRSYCDLHTSDRKISFSCPLNKLSRKLNHPSLARISRSQVVNVNKIIRIIGNTLILEKGNEEKEVLLTKSYKPSFLKKIPLVK